MLYSGTIYIYWIIPEYKINQSLFLKFLCLSSFVILRINIIAVAKNNKADSIKQDSDLLTIENNEPPLWNINTILYIKTHNQIKIRNIDTVFCHLILFFRTKLINIPKARENISISMLVVIVLKLIIQTTQDNMTQDIPNLQALAQEHLEQVYPIQQ